MNGFFILPILANPHFNTQHVVFPCIFVKEMRFNVAHWTSNYIGRNSSHTIIIM